MSDYMPWYERHLGKPLLDLHDTIYKKTGGRIGHRIPLPGMAPNLLLHTVGAKTGIKRTTSLSYAKDGDSYLAPGWYHNLKANPAIEINVGPKRFAVTANAVLPDDPDYARLFRVVNKNNHNVYEGYQKRTTRPIPVVKLTP
jgi:deazaflavin-dependent oxidoreductase (nitroreductase family)